jgi:hypothetical protein
MVKSPAEVFVDREGGPLSLEVRWILPGRVVETSSLDLMLVRLAALASIDAPTAS